MSFDNEVLLLAIGVIFPVGFLALVLFHTGRIYATWAKLASIFACMSGLGWGILGFFLIHPQNLHVTRHTYFVLLAFKHILGGLSLGFMFSVLLARPYQKRASEPSTRAA
jgi:hypothetical protein